jgi:hypothetical protein
VTAVFDDETPGGRNFPALASLFCCRVDGGKADMADL